MMVMPFVLNCYKVKNTLNFMEIYRLLVLPISIMSPLYL